jgi:hypothetical protein
VLAAIRHLLPAVGGPSVTKIILMIGAILLLWSSNATAQQRLVSGVRHCVADLGKLCPDVPPGNNNPRTCLREHIHDVSFPCLLTLAKFAEVRRFREECGAHLQQQCAGVERGGGQFGACLRSAVASLSDACKYALARAVRRARHLESTLSGPEGLTPKPAHGNNRPQS